MRFKKTLLKFAMIGVVAMSLTGCGYNQIQLMDENVKGAWGEVLNQYKSRNDLLPQLAKVTSAYAKHEKEVFQSVSDARAKMGSINVNMEEVPDEETMKKYMQAQDQMSGALSRLMAVAEAYPELKADQNFRQLSAQIEGRENRVNVARNRYIKSVKEYNVFIRQFPYNITAMIFKYKVKPSLQFQDEQKIQEMPDLQL